MLPKRRTSKLLVEELADETLVYDLVRHKAHCLNRVASLLWQWCDGKTPVSQLGVMLAKALGVPVERTVVAAALAQLERAYLLELPGGTGNSRQRLNRRQMTRELAVASLASLVVTVTSPPAAQAQSGLICCSNQSQCPPGFNCSGGPRCAGCAFTRKCCR